MEHILIIINKYNYINKPISYYLLPMSFDEIRVNEELNISSLDG